MEALRAELQKLQAQRSAIEADIKQRSDRLDEPGQPGFSGSLLDKEGFPRSDIDIHAVRTDRNTIIRLTNDHKQISNQLEQLLHRMHALARETGAVASANGQPASNGAATTAAAAAAAVGTSGQLQDHEIISSPTDAPAAAAPSVAAAAAAAALAAGSDVALRPFAVVDDVADGSPAAAAGIRLGDQLCRFGAAVVGSGNELQQVAQELAAHEDHEVPVMFLRAGQAVQMQLTPRRWAGRGLLGCHLRPL